MGDCRETALRYFYEQAEETAAAFPDMEFDVQFRIMICAKQYLHPPRGRYSRLLAAEGESVVSRLMVKLADAEEPLTRGDIIEVFLRMQEQGDYDVAGNDVLMALIQHRALESPSAVTQSYVRRIVELGADAEE